MTLQESTNVLSVENRSRGVYVCEPSKRTNIRAAVQERESVCLSKTHKQPRFWDDLRRVDKYLVGSARSARLYLVTRDHRVKTVDIMKSMNFEIPSSNNGHQERKEPNINGRIERERAKLDALEKFEPTGDIYEDFNVLIDISGKNTLYRNVDDSVHPDVVLAALAGLKTTWESMLKLDAERDAKKNDEVGVTTDKSPEYEEAVRLTNYDVPQKLVEVTDSLVSFYLENRVAGADDSQVRRFDD